MSLQEAIAKQGILTLDKALSTITKGDVIATVKLRDIYILLVSTPYLPKSLSPPQPPPLARGQPAEPYRHQHSAEAKIINAQHRLTQLTTAGNSSVSIPEELEQAFFAVVDAMHKLQQRMWVNRYPVMMSHGESAEVCAMFSMNLEG